MPTCMVFSRRSGTPQPHHPHPACLLVARSAPIGISGLPLSMVARLGRVSFAAGDITSRVREGNRSRHSQRRVGLLDLTPQAKG